MESGVGELAAFAEIALAIPWKSTGRASPSARKDIAFAPGAPAALIGSVMNPTGSVVAVCAPAHRERPSSTAAPATGRRKDEGFIEGEGAGCVLHYSRSLNK